MLNFTKIKMFLLNQNEEKAFTIVESLVAILILTIGFVAVTQIFPFNLKIDKSSEMKTKAIQLAQAKLEELNSKSYDEINCDGSAVPCTETENQVSEDIAFRRVTIIKFADPQNGLQEPSPISTDTGIKKIEITLYWRSVWGTGENNIKIVSLISEK